MDATIRRDLADVQRRREAALDRFVNAWVELVNLAYRSDVLLDRANEREKAPA